MAMDMNGADQQGIPPPGAAAATSFLELLRQQKMQELADQLAQQKITEGQQTIAATNLKTQKAQQDDAAAQAALDSLDMPPQVKSLIQLSRKNPGAVPQQVIDAAMQQYLPPKTADYNLNPGETRFSGKTNQPLAAAAPKPPAQTGEFLTTFLPAYARKKNKTVDQLTPDETFQAFSDYAQRGKDPEMAGILKELAAGRLAQQDAANAEPKEVQPDTPEFRVAQDLAYGKLTMGQFRSLYAYSRDAKARVSIYQKAADLNPNFNPALFEMGYTLAKNPKVQQQLASLDNVARGVPDLLKFSDAAQRSGVAYLNQYTLPAGAKFGNKSYSNFQTARTAMADELSGALGYGSATDMSRQMGFDMTNPALSPAQFRDALQSVVMPFVMRKRQTLLDQMGVYGMPGMNPGAGAAGGAVVPDKIWDGHKLIPNPAKKSGGGD